MKRTILISIALSLLVTSCFDFGNEREGCNGQIIIENEIPDTTLTIGGEPFRRDVFEKPIVFSHTENENITISVTSLEGGDTVIATRQVNQKTGRATIVQVEPRKVGEDVVRVVATDDCEGYEVIETFTVRATN